MDAEVLLVIGPTPPSKSASEIPAQGTFGTAAVHVVILNSLSVVMLSLSQPNSGWYACPLKMIVHKMSLCAPDLLPNMHLSSAPESLAEAAAAKGWKVVCNAVVVGMNITARALTLMSKGKASALFSIFKALVIRRSHFV